MTASSGTTAVVTTTASATDVIPAAATDMTGVYASVWGESKQGSGDRCLKGASA